MYESNTFESGRIKSPENLSNTTYDLLRNNSDLTVSYNFNGS